ncbi:unnamed protein product, partial [Lepidochelys olivacea]
EPFMAADHSSRVKIAPPGKSSERSIPWTASSYTNLYNVLNFPAGVLPVTVVTEADEEELKNYRGHYSDPWDKRLREAVEGAVGLPVAVQCVALPWQEELCLRFMKEVETLARKRKRNVGPTDDDEDDDDADDLDL